MEILLALTVGALNVVCFFIGAKVGQTVSKDKELEFPSPVKAYEAHLERREMEEEKNKLETILGNIERYDGTENGQEDVPR